MKDVADKVVTLSNVGFTYNRFIYTAAFVISCCGGPGFLQYLSAASSELRKLSQSMSGDNRGYEELDSLLALYVDVLYAVPRLISSCETSVPIRDASFNFCIRFYLFLSFKLIPYLKKTRFTQ